MVTRDNCDCCNHSNHLRTFGLSKSVLQGEQTPDAEETVRLCLYDVNRGETEQANQLMTDECEP